MNVITAVIITNPPINPNVMIDCTMPEAFSVVGVEPENADPPGVFVDAA
ncbi:hypothetical protein NHH03_23470 [Stieleria sp. TO1_6]|nr:hypothetical protein [Stieleria tagensis]MCO8124719.1 hypothetical protein [Stieleria tagensis]